MEAAPPGAASTSSTTSLAIAPRNQVNAQGNKTLRTRCAACGTETTTDVGNDPFDRKTWALVGEEQGRPTIYPACSACYTKGWRPPGFRPAAI